jgi:predicted component of type VI protein secretion system
MNWDGFQREVLAALGHRVYALGQPEPQPQPQVQAVPSPGPRASPAHGPASPLLAALARAAGVEVARLPDLPALKSLRGDARAKRALWPRLRALRRP